MLCQIHLLVKAIRFLYVRTCILYQSIIVINACSVCLCIVVNDILIYLICINVEVYCHKVYDRSINQPI